MLQFFLNPWLLAGLAGISLPIIAHLLSRRRFDVVDWAAMQFLNPARRTRRRLRLEELLLLMLRIGMIALLAFAAARPWIAGGWLSGFRSSGSRAVVLIVDGSNSMSRSDGLNTVHQSAIRRANEILDALGPGDQVALIDARDQPRTVIESPVQDLKAVTEALGQLPPPSGAADLPAAIENAVAILARSSNTAREIILLTDRQRSGWRADDIAAWERLDDLRSFPAVKPQLWVLDVANHLAPVGQNVAVGTIVIPRDLTVPDFPLTLNVTVTNASAEEVSTEVRLLQNGQPLAGRQQAVRIPANSEVAVPFDATLRQTGTILISAEATVSGDQIPADNMSHAVVSVASAVPVLLINGAAAVNPVDRETFFAALALTSPGHRTPWVQATVVDAADVTIEQIQRSSIVVLADVADLPTAIPAALRDFVSRGNGIIVCCGPNTTTQSFDRLMRESAIVPTVQLVRRREAGVDDVKVAPLTIQPGWLDRFHNDPSRSFLKSRFQNWWLTKIVPKAAQATKPANAIPQDLAEDSNPGRPPVVLAQLINGDPLLIDTQLGDGSVLLWTSSLSRVWNDFPTMSDYVPFLHEAVFQAAASRVRRNVSFGSPLVAELHAPTNVSFLTPSGQTIAVAATGDATRPIAVLNDTLLPGVYQLKPASDPKSAALDTFVVNYDHREDDQSELDARDLASLRAKDRLHFVKSVKQLNQQMYGSESRTELWAAILFSFLGLMIGELILTRRIVRRGHSGPDGDTPLASVT